MFWNVFNLLFLSAKSKFRMNTQSTYTAVFILLFVVFQIESSSAACTKDTECINGYCDSVSEMCVCYDGWQGTNCDHCGGRSRLVETSGHIVESPGNYKVAQKCSWLIDSQRNNTPIHIRLEEFGTECSWDYLYIYDGDSVHSPLVAALSGPVRFDTADIRHQFTLTSGFAYLYFYSDAAYILDGFNISYSIGDCRDRNCSSNGVCDTETFQCQCFDGWSGDGCNVPDCPNDCGSYGTCVNGQCNCSEGFYGRDCGTQETAGLWEISDDSSVFSRAAAASVVIDDELWLIGGYGFIKESSMPVFKYNFTSGISEQVPVTSETGRLPQPRYGHSAAFHEGIILIYGGSLVDGPVSSELWLLNTTSLIFVDATGSDSQPLEGHTAHIINDSMLVFFGYNPTFGYVRWVQHYNISSNSWSILDVTGFPVFGSFGHSSVYSKDLGKIFVFGGYPFVRFDDFTESPLYEFDVERFHWEIRKSPKQARFFHSAVLSKNKMYVFGGNSHTDSNQYEGAECYTDSFLVYDTDCDQWFEEEVSSGVKEELSRYGHQAAWYNDVMWTFGGYNGVMLNSVITYTPVKCSSISNETDCELAGSGPTCMWDITLSECIQINLNATFQHNASLLECDPPTNSFNCSEAPSCLACIEKPGCGWCNGQCSSSCANESHYQTCDEQTCEFLLDCHDCHSVPDCRWIKTGCRRMENQDTIGGCLPPCASKTSCSECTSNTKCMWCESQNRCIDSSTYMTSFPFGTCLSWVTNNCGNIKCSDHDTCEECHEDPSCGWCDKGDGTGLGTCVEGGDSGPFNMSDAQCETKDWYFTECPSCQCNGHSICLDGETCSNCSDFTTGDHCETCLLGYHGVPLNGANCSRCQCNGHSQYCDQNSIQSKCFCDTKGITGDKCDRCDEQRGYYGDPTVNTCYYQLNINFKYFFNESEPELVNITKENLLLKPVNSRSDIDFELMVDEPVILRITMLSNLLQMNYKYTFQLDDSSGENLTKINLYVQPLVQNRDIEFILTVNEPVNFTITYTTTSVEDEQIIVNSTYVENVYRYRFSRYTYDFRNEVNTTFLFYLSDFTHPFTFRVQVEENPFTIIVITFGVLIGFLSFCALALLMIQKICIWHLSRVVGQVQVTQQIQLEDLLRFFIVFFSVFLSFMCFFALGWKLKMRVDTYLRSQITIYHPAVNLIVIFVTFLVCFILILVVFLVALKGRERVDMYRRRRQREVEMAVMARRPFASIFVELENNAPPDLIATTKSKPVNAIGLAVEPLKESKAALATIFIQLPLADGLVPIGQSRVTLATALVVQKGKKLEQHTTRPEVNNAASPRITPNELMTREPSPNGRPNTARDIEVSCDDSCNHAYDNPAMV